MRSRRSIRLPDYDYADPGVYFVTVCTHEHECLFGDVSDGEVALNEFGQIVSHEWARSADIRDELSLADFVVMPNHLHGIVRLGLGAHGRLAAQDRVGAHGRAPLRRDTPSGDAGSLHRPGRSLGSFIAGFKSAVTKRINLARGTPGEPVWQRNYYEHIVRDEDDLLRIRQYIQDNPLKWDSDEYHPARIPVRA